MHSKQSRAHHSGPSGLLQEVLKYYREGELTNGRWAMAAVAGILFTDLVRAVQGGRGSCCNCMRHNPRAHTRLPRAAAVVLRRAARADVPRCCVRVCLQVGLGNWWEAGAKVESSFDLKTLIIIEVRWGAPRPGSVRTDARCRVQCVTAQLQQPRAASVPGGRACSPLQQHAQTLLSINPSNSFQT